MEENKEIKRKQITFDIDADMHLYIKMDALLRGITINAWMKSVLYKEIENRTKNI